MCSKKNWNLLRGLKHASCFLLFALGFLSFMSCDKQEMLQNRWNLESVSVNGSPIDSAHMKFHLLPKYTYYIFFLENSLNIATLANGQYTESADGYYKFADRSTLEMRFKILGQPKQDIKAKIKKLTNKELNLEYTDNGDTYFLKLYTN